MSGRQSAATAKAIKLVEAGMTRYSAAKKAGISLATIYRAWKQHTKKKHP